jgi:hypothetical protein
MEFYRSGVNINDVDNTNTMKTYNDVTDRHHSSSNRHDEQLPPKKKTSANKLITVFDQLKAPSFNFRRQPKSSTSGPTTTHYSSADTSSAVGEMVDQNRKHHDRQQQQQLQQQNCPHYSVNYDADKDREWRKPGRLTADDKWKSTSAVDVNHSAARFAFSAWSARPNEYSIDADGCGKVRRQPNGTETATSIYDDTRPVIKATTSSTAAMGLASGEYSNFADFSRSTTKSAGTGAPNELSLPHASIAEAHRNYVNSSDVAQLQRTTDDANLADVPPIAGRAQPFVSYDEKFIDNLAPCQSVEPLPTNVAVPCLPERNTVPKDECTGVTDDNGRALLTLMFTPVTETNAAAVAAAASASAAQASAFDRPHPPPAAAAAAAAPTTTSDVPPQLPPRRYQKRAAGLQQLAAELVAVDVVDQRRACSPSSPPPLPPGPSSRQNVGRTTIVKSSTTSRYFLLLAPPPIVDQPPPPKPSKPHIVELFWAGDYM